MALSYDEDAVTAEDRLGVVRVRLADMRRTLKDMRHTTLCATFVDNAPEEECQCSKRAVMAWIDHVADAAGQ